MTARPTHAALITPVAASTDIGAARNRLDASASWGVPAHVSLIYPFRIPDEDEVPAVAAALEAVAGRFDPFRSEFVETGWFGSTDLWVRPEPADRFLELTTAVWSALPSFMPFADRAAHLPPHLPVAEGGVGTEEELRTVERDLNPRLPFGAVIDRIQLIAGRHEPRSWSVLQEARLGSGTASLPKSAESALVVAEATP